MEPVTTCNCGKVEFPLRTRAVVDGFTRIVSFRPGWICPRPRTDPGSHGRNGVEMAWILAGPDAADGKPSGVVEWSVLTGWEPDWAIKDILHGMKPVPGQIGLHARTPLFDGHQPRTDCSWFAPCYYDVTYTGAHDLFRTFVTEGEEAVWKQLEKFYVGERPK